MELQAKIDAFIEENRAALVEDLGALIAVRSLEELDKAAPGAPFGPEPRRALDIALAISQRLGLETNDGDGYVGWAEVPGREDGYLAAIAHLDVVPEGEGWNTDPYTMAQREGWLLGRGVEDDKGPAILCLYAAKFLKENADDLRYPVRILLGCNEESGMGDVDGYLEKHPEPLFCFSPDANFPVCNGEKGVYEGEFTSADLSGGNLLSFEGGSASNVIPDKASCLVKGDASKLEGNEWVTVSGENGAVRLSAKGVGGHAAHPEGTTNAIGKLVEYLLANDLCSDTENTFLALLYKLHTATDGSGVGIACKDARFDPLTVVGGFISLENGRLTQNINCRYPLAITGDTITATLAALAANHAATYAAKGDSAPMYVEPDSAPVKALMDTWAEVSGRSDPAYTMGGGTYARHFKHAVAFGAVDPQEKRPDFIGSIHGANEGANLETLLRALKIYILAFLRLEELDYQA